MLRIKDLYVSVDGKDILNGVSLNLERGTVHAIMGPNGSGKSTLAHALAGHPKCVAKSGSVSIDGEEITSLRADKRAHRGLFLAFQYPKEIPGVPVSSFVRTAVSSVRKQRGLPALNPLEFRKTLRTALTELGLPSSFMNRSINDGFSGGEKKKIEMLQMTLLEPKIAILDETDSGLDVDALKIVAEGIRRFATKERTILLITHYQRILHYVRPDFVHVMKEGHIVASGGPELGERLEREGYDWVKTE